MPDVEPKRYTLAVEIQDWVFDKPREEFIGIIRNEMRSLANNFKEHVLEEYDRRNEESN